MSSEIIMTQLWNNIAINELDILIFFNKGIYKGVLLRP